MDGKLCHSPLGVGWCLVGVPVLELATFTLTPRLFATWACSTSVHRASAVVVCAVAIGGISTPSGRPFGRDQPNPSAARAGPTSEALAAAHREPVRAPSAAPSANQRWGWRLSGALTPAGGSVCMAYRWYVGTLHAVGGRWSTTGPARSGGVCTMVLHHGMMGPSGRVPSWPPREPPPRGALRSRSRLSRRRVPARDGGI